jgi:hypothetical protein
MAVEVSSQSYSDLRNHLQNIVSLESPQELLNAYLIMEAMLTGSQGTREDIELAMLVESFWDENRELLAKKLSSQTQAIIDEYYPHIDSAIKNIYDTLSLVIKGNIAQFRSDLSITLGTLEKMVYTDCIEWENFVLEMNRRLQDIARILDNANTDKPVFYKLLQ